MQELHHRECLHQRLKEGKKPGERKPSSFTLRNFTLKETMGKDYICFMMGVFNIHTAIDFNGICLERLAS